MRSRSQVGAARQVLGLIVLSGSVCTTPVAAQCELNAVYVNEPDTLGDQFGFAVSISGDYAIVGAYLDTPPDPNPPPPVIEAAGAAYIVRRVGANWQVQQRLVAPEQQELAWFGYSVDIDGDYAVVGAPGHETNGLGAAGAVFVYKRSGLNWVYQQQLIASDFNSNDWLGVSVAINGDRIITGAMRDDDAGSQSGSAYVFRRVGETWVQEGKLTAADGAIDDFFGGAVDISGDRAVVGAERKAPPEASKRIQHGAAYFFDWNGAAWMPAGKVYDFGQPSAGGFFFGKSVSMDGDVTVIGAPQPNGGGGSAHFFHRIGATWTFMEKVVPFNHDGNDAFGISVSVSGDYAAIGSRNRDQIVGGVLYPDAGGVHVFKRYGSDWLESFELNAMDAGAGDQCGFSCAIGGDRVIAGGPLDDVGASLNAGSAHIFAAAGPECPGDRFWFQALSGDFDTPASWEPGVPGQLNSAIFEVPGPFTVDFQSNVRNLRLEIADGEVTFDLNGREYALTETADASFSVGESPGDIATLAMLNGTVRGVYSEIGTQSGAQGSLLVSGPTTSWVTDQTLCVGCNGQGLLAVDGGALASTRYATIGLSAGSHGSALLTDPGTAWYIASSLTVANGRFTVQDGASMNFGIAGSGITILGGGEVTGDSVISGRMINYGQVIPGPDSGAGSMGTLTVGDYIQAAQDQLLGPSSGVLRIDMDATTPTITTDKLVANGTAILGGGLFVSRLGTNDPELNQFFDILVANSIPAGSRFDVALLPGLGQNRYLRVNVPQDGFLGTQVVTLEVRPLDELVNLNGTDPVGITGGPVDAVVGDFDLANGPDLAVLVAGATENDPGQVFILLNDGSGELDLATTQTPVGRSPSAIAAKDFNQDGWLDLAVTNKVDNTVSILVNTADGSGAVLQDPDPIPVGEGPVDLAAADFGGSLAPDFVVVNSLDNTAVEYRNTIVGSSATFAPAGTLITNVLPTSVDPADVDNDRDTDVVVATVGGGGSGSNGTAMLFLNNGEAGFGLPQQFPVGVNPSQVIVGDLNNDPEFPEVLVVNQGDDENAGSISVLVNLGSPQGWDGLQPPVNLPVGDPSLLEHPASTTVVDLEPDGDPDIVFVVDDGARNIVRVLRNDLNEQQLAFAQAADLPDAPEGTELVLQGDLDGQNGPDLITVVVEPAALDGAGPIAASAQVLLNSAGIVCIADIAPLPAGNGTVNVDDLLAVINAWGPCASPPPAGKCPADIAPSGAPNGIVNVDDLLAIINAWGPCPN